MAWLSKEELAQYVALMQVDPNITQNNMITSYTITNPGQGYSSPPIHNCTPIAPVPKPFPQGLTYTGIGSRETPVFGSALMHLVAQRLAEQKWILRSGHAEGTDQFFEKGCDALQGRKEIFLPWRNFCGSDSVLWNQPKAAFAVAEYIHPAWHNCSQGAKKLHARNVQQILGYDLNDPTNLVICWTKDGVTQGGTATAIHIAEELAIPVINLGYSYFDKFTVDNLLGVIEKQIYGAKYNPIAQTKIGQILQDNGVAI